MIREASLMKSAVKLWSDVRLVVRGRRWTARCGNSRSSLMRKHLALWLLGSEQAMDMVLAGVVSVEGEDSVVVVVARAID